MKRAKGGFHLRRGVLYHAFRSGTLTASSELARVWSDRGSALEQMTALNSDPHLSLPAWTVERAVPETVTDSPVNPCMLLSCVRALVPDAAPTRDAELRKLLPQIDAILAEVRRANEDSYGWKEAA